MPISVKTGTDSLVLTFDATLCYLLLRFTWLGA